MAQPPPNLLATNTLTIPNIPLAFYQIPDILPAIHAKFATFGPIYKFIPIKGFRRILIIYMETLHAMVAKDVMDRIMLPWNEDGHTVPLASPEERKKNASSDNGILLRVYFGEVNGNDQICWEQIREDAPNTLTLSDDLVSVLTALAASGGALTSQPIDQTDNLYSLTPATSLDELEDFTLPEARESDLANGDDLANVKAAIADKTGSPPPIDTSEKSPVSPQSSTPSVIFTPPTSGRNSQLASPLPSEASIEPAPQGLPMITVENCDDANDGAAPGSSLAAAWAEQRARGGAPHPPSSKPILHTARPPINE
ncbi:hypothetical protein BZG36_01022 [Bifiguratus adelaidae]|uniref:Calcipressin n=1 Tax=Bifiguratus adelaidae TaxID=1938954 RepID=A0A261Y6A7_9FUNG|nr:hypothetical protein BZG36_01022 [Bifiguratus adelaidae]